MNEGKTNITTERHIVKFPTGQSAVTINEMVEAVKGSKYPKASLLALEIASENARVLLWSDYKKHLKSL